MKKFIRITSAILCAIPMATGLAACNGGGSSGSGAVELVVWEDESNIDMLEELADSFAADYSRAYPNAPTIKITFEPQSEQSAMENLNQYGPVGSGADITAFVHDQLGTGVSYGSVAPVQNPQAFSVLLGKNANSAMTYDDTLYGYAYTSESLTFMYDKSKLDASEVNDMEALSAALRADSNKIGWYFHEDSCYYTSGLMTDSKFFEGWTEEGWKYSEASLDLDTAASVANLTKFASSYRDVIESYTPDELFDLLANNRIVGFVSSPFMWGNVQELLGDNAGIVKLPAVDGVTQTPFSGYKGYAVSSYTEHPFEAHAFASYLVSQFAQEFRLVKQGVLPVTADQSWLDERIDANPSRYAAVSVFRESLADSVVMPNVKEMGSMWAPMKSAVGKIWAADSVTEDIVKGLLADAESSIKTTLAG